MGVLAIFPFHDSLSFDAVVVLFKLPSHWGILGETSLSFLGDQISQWVCEDLSLALSAVAVRGYHAGSVPSL